MRTGITYLLALFIATFSAYAVYETPTSTDGCRIEPYALGMHVTVLDSLQSVCKKQGYWIVPLVETEYEHVTLDEFAWHLTYSTGIFGIATEGGLQGLAVEVFPYTHEGEVARDSAYQYYLANGYSEDEIFTDEKTNYGYHIGVKPQLIDACFRSANSIVHVGACYGLWHAWAWNDARDYLSYNSAVYDATVESDASTFWSRLNGTDGKQSRYVGAALSGLTLQASSTSMLNTVLSPTVEAISPPEGTEIDSAGVDGLIRFDTRMDTQIDANYIIDGDSRVAVEDAYWDTEGDKDVIRFHLRSITEGTGRLQVRASLATSQGGMALDGNTEPTDTDGVGPNGDDYLVEYDCTYTDEDIAARYGAMWAYRDGSDVKVGWHVEAEVGTWGYEVQGFEGGTWHKLAQLNQGETILPKVYEVTVAGGYSLYRVVEIDIRGRYSPGDHLTVSAHEPEIARRVKEIFPSYYEETPVRSKHTAICCETSRTRVKSKSVPDWIFYGPDSLVAETMPAVSYLQSQGLVVDTIYATSSYH